ncbi:MAG: glycosyltransferase family 39 protein [Candidatus Margulisiibacteriota bacterium]
MKKNAILLCLLAAALYFFRLGAFSLYDAAETTYGEFTKNILQMNDWLTLHYNGQVIFDKPPLYYWLAALLSRLVGFNEWAMRFWAALAGVLTVLATYAFGQRFYNERAGFLSGVVVMTAFQFLVQSRIAELDVVLTLFLFSALFLFLAGYQTNDRRYYVLMYFPLALGVLIKGLLAVALPGCAIFLFLLFKKELVKIKGLAIIPGILIVAVIGLPWYIAEYLIHGQVFLNFALGFLFLSRFQGVVAGHTGPWYYYFPALLIGFAPWSHLLPLGLWQTWQAKKNDPELLALCFIIPALIVFSVAKTKIPNYVLPLYPFLALMVGAAWDKLLREPGTERRGFLIANLFLAVVVALIFAGVMMVGNNQYPAQYATLVPPLQALAAALLLGSAAAITLFFLKAYRLAFAAIPAMVFVIALVLTLWALPAVEPLKGEKELGQKVTAVIRPAERIAAYSVGNRPGIVFYNSRTVVMLSTEAEARGFLNARQGFLFTAERPLAFGRLFARQGELFVYR